MRDLMMKEVSSVSGGAQWTTVYQAGNNGQEGADSEKTFEFNGCDYIGFKDIGSIAASTGALATTLGASSGKSSVATKVGIIGVAVGTAAVVGYNAGVKINHSIGQCPN